MVDYQVDETVPSLIIRYKSRKDAELAFAQGKSFSAAANLEVQWHLPPGSAPKVKEGDELQSGDAAGGDGMVGSPSAEEEEDDENEVHSRVKTDKVDPFNSFLYLFFSLSSRVLTIC